MFNSTCIALYGIGRNKNLGQEISFYRKVFNEPSFIYFLYVEDTVDNPRSNESGTIDYSFLKYLNVSIIPVKLDLYSEFRKIINFSIDPHNDGRKSLNNLLKQLLMLNQIASHLCNVNNYQNFLVIRDDVRFSPLSKVLLFFKQPIPSIDSVIALSAFSWHGGFNDKFFIANKRVMLLISRRIDHMKEFIEDRGYLNAEHLLEHTIRLHEIEVNPIFLNVGRVRINGTVVWDKYFPAITRPKDIYRVFRILFIKLLKRF